MNLTIQISVFQATTNAKMIMGATHDTILSLANASARQAMNLMVVPVRKKR
jgi:hypothetical protein